MGMMHEWKARRCSQIRQGSETMEQFRPIAPHVCLWTPFRHTLRPECVCCHSMPGGYKEQLHPNSYYHLIGTRINFTLIHINIAFDYSRSYDQALPLHMKSHPLVTPESSSTLLMTHNFTLQR